MSNKLVETTTVQTHVATVEKMHTDIVASNGLTDPLTYWQREKNLRANFAKTIDNLVHKSSNLDAYLVARIVHAFGLGIVLPLLISGLLWLSLRRVLVVVCK